MGGKGSFYPGNGVKKAKTEVIREKLQEVITVRKWSRVQSEEELAQRFDDYFRYCAENGVYPTLEEMYVATGYSFDTVRDWARGKYESGLGKNVRDIIICAKDVIRTLDAKMVVDGEIDNVTYFFRAKNFYGMADQQEIVVTPNNPLGQATPTRELEEHYIKAITD